MLLCISIKNRVSEERICYCSGDFVMFSYCMGDRKERNMMLMITLVLSWIKTFLIKIGNALQVFRK